MTSLFWETGFRSHGLNPRNAERAAIVQCSEKGKTPTMAGVCRSPGSDGTVLTAGAGLSVRSGGRFERDPAVGPPAQCVYGVVQFQALLGEPVLDPDRGFGMNDPLHDALVLEFFQALGEHPVTQPGNDRAQVGEPGDVEEHRPQDRPGPSFPDDFDGMVIARAESGVGDVHGPMLRNRK